MSLMVIFSKMEQIHSLLILLLVLLILFYVVKTITRKLSNYPPGPFPLPIIGNTLHFCTWKPHITLTNLAKVHGPLMSLQVGPKVIIIGSTHEVTMAFLKNYNQIMSSRPEQHTYCSVFGEEFELPTILGAIECTDSWKMLRALMKTEFLPAGVMDSNAIWREQKVKELIDFLRTKEGKVVEIGELVFTTAVNIVSKLLVSVDLIDIKDEAMARVVKELITKTEELASTVTLGHIFPTLKRCEFLGVGKKFRELSRRFFPCWEGFIDKRLARNASGDACKEKDFLDVLLAKGFSKDQINWFVSEIFITSIDTTSSTIEWAMSELIKNQEAMKKLRQELAREIDGDMVKDSDLRRLPYLNACVKETLRLRPTAPIILRRAIETCEVMSYTIPKDSIVRMNVWALGRDPSKWEDPSTFKPIRFLESNLDFRGCNYEYLPFGTGNRMCPGLPLAARLVPLVVASLVHAFDWDLPGDMSPDELDMNAKIGITLQREKPLLLIPKLKYL